MSDEPAAQAPPAAKPAARNDFADRAAAEALSGGSARANPTKGRTFSEATRNAFKTAASSVAKAVAEGVEDDDMVAVGSDEASAPPAAAPASSPAQASHPPAGGAPSPEAAAIATLHAERERILNDREKRLTESESKRKELLASFRDDPADTIRQMLKEAHGVDDVRTLAMDLVTELSGDVLGLEVPEQHRAKAERRKAERLIKEHNASLAKREAETKKQREDMEREYANRAAKDALRPLLEQAKASYPYLMSEDQPHDLVWRVAESIAESDPTWVPSWKSAAERAEKYLKDQAGAYYSKRRHLLNPESTPKQPTAATTPQERPPGSRSRVTLTNGEAQESSARTTAPRGPVSNEDRRRASLSKLRASIQPDE